MIEHAADALDDRQAEAEPARHLGALVEPLEFPEDHRGASMTGCRGRCRQTSTRSFPPRRRQPTSTRPFGVYLIALETRFCSSRRSSRRSERIASRAGHELQLEAFLAGQRGELDLELAQQIVDAEAGELRPHRAGVEPRDVEQRAEDLFDRLERGIDVVDEPRSSPSLPRRSHQRW